MTRQPDTAAIADQVRSARDRRAALRIVAGGSWLRGGRSCRAAEQLELSGLSGIIRYEPGDFVLTARAGTPLDVIAWAAAEHGQWLTLDPIGEATGTIGATVSTASFGALASAYGTPRDHVLGCEFVSGRGDVIRAGGQVVKNVAGFDLVRLVTGAWGTLGVLTEVTLRMRARPEADQTLAVRLEGDGAAQLWRWIRDTEFTPLAAELLSPSLSQQLGLGGVATALVRLGGNATLVRSATDAVGALGQARQVDATIWNTWNSSFAAAAMTFRASATATRTAAEWRTVMQWAENNGGFASATLARGVIRCAISQGGTTTDSPGALQHLTTVGEQLDAEWWRLLHRDRSTKTLEAKVRDAFDPDQILNPGILGT